MKPFIYKKTEKNGRIGREMARLVEKSSVVSMTRNHHQPSVETSLHYEREHILPYKKIFILSNFD